MRLGRIGRWKRSGRKLRQRELTPEEQEEQEIKEEVFIETSGFSSREEYEAHQQELIRDIQACEWEAEQQEDREEAFRKGDLR